MPVSIALELTSLQTLAGAVAPSARGAQPGAGHTPTAAERVLAAEMKARREANDALSMMVGSMVRMVQAGRSSASRWQAS